MSENSTLKPISFRCISANNYDGWFCDIYYNALFHVDLCTGELFLETFLGANTKEAYSPIAYYEEKLVIAPRNADNILIYDIKRKIARKIMIDMSEEYIGKYSFNLFSAVEIYGIYAYVFPGRYHAIIKINLVNFDIEYIDGWYSQLSCAALKEENKVIFSDFVERTEDGKFVLVCWQTNLIMIFDAGTEKWEIVRTGICGKALTSVVWEKGGARTVSYRDDSVLTVYPYGRQIELKEYIAKGGACVFDSCTKLFVTSNAGGWVISIDKETEKKELIADFAEDVEETQGAQYYIACRKKVKNRYIVLSVITTGRLAIIDTANGDVVVFDMDLSEEDKQSIGHYKQNLRLKGKKIYESDHFRLKDMMGLLKCSKNIEIVSSEALSCGELIFSEAINSV